MLSVAAKGQKVRPLLSEWRHSAFQIPPFLPSYRRAQERAGEGGFSWTEGLEKPLECGFESLGPIFATKAPPSPLLSFHDFSPTVSTLNPNHCFSRVKFKSKPHGSPNTQAFAKWERVLGKQ